MADDRAIFGVGEKTTSQPMAEGPQCPDFFAN